MARTPDPLSKKQSAVVGALGLYATTPPEAAHTEPLTKIMQMANKALQRIDEQLTQTEFDTIMSNLKESKFVVMGGDDVPTLSALLVVQPELDFRGPNADLQRAQFLGESLFLRIQELDSRGIEYVVEFNCDGSGGKRLPSGEIVTTSFASLTAQLRQDHNIRAGDSSGVNNWFVCAEHHPNAPHKKCDRQLRNYLRLLNRQDPSRRQRIQD